MTAGRSCAVPDDHGRLLLTGFADNPQDIVDRFERLQEGLARTGRKAARFVSLCRFFQPEAHGFEGSGHGK